MLRNLFLYLVARRHIGSVAALGDGHGGPILTAGPLGLAYQQGDGTRVHRAWPDVHALTFGEAVDASHRVAVEFHRSRTARGQTKPDRKALSDAEIEAVAREDAARGAGVTETTVMVLGQ